MISLRTDLKSLLLPDLPGDFQEISRKSPPTKLKSATTNRSIQKKKRRRQTNSAPNKKRLKKTDIRDFFTTQTAVSSVQTPLKLPAHVEHLTQPWCTRSSQLQTTRPQQYLDSLLIATPEFAPVTTTWMTTTPDATPTSNNDTPDLWCAPAPSSDNNSLDQWCVPAPTPDDVQDV